MYISTAVTANTVDIEWYRVTGLGSINAAATINSGSGTFSFVRKTSSGTMPVRDVNGSAAVYASSFDLNLALAKDSVFGVQVSGASSLNADMLITGPFVKHIHNS